MTLTLHQQLPARILDLVVTGYVKNTLVSGDCVATIAVETQVTAIGVEG